MKIGNHVINTEKLSFILNIISFIAGLLFYVRMARVMENRQASAPIPVNNALHDSALIIETKLNIELNILKHVQDSLVNVLQVNEQKLGKQKQAVKVVRQQIHTTINSDWDKLDKNSQNDYTNKLLLNLKRKQVSSDG